MKMICILSHSFLEPTTEAVMDWLRAWGVPHVRFNGEDVDQVNGPTFLINSSCTKLRITIDGKAIDPGDIKVVWYRRWHHNSRHNEAPVLRHEADRTKMNTLLLFMHLRNELNVISQTIFAALAQASWLGSHETAAPNKLDVLQTAAGLGLDVPDTLVTTDVSEVRGFVEKHGEVVTKACADLLMCAFNKTIFTTYTEVVPSAWIGENPWKGGFPSLFQEKLDKRYEIRSFFLDDRFYSMAMFTQRRSETSVDFRRYTYKDPARLVPYKLDDAIEDKLRALMRTLHLETGSIDLVQTKNGRLVFLEVNPVGQFGMVSAPCNYYLEREVARSLVRRFYGNR
jgi:ATP-GRASP peptide maturase of grasp-with-spasm system